MVYMIRYPDNSIRLFETPQHLSNFPAGCRQYEVLNDLTADVLCSFLSGCIQPETLQDISFINERTTV